MNDKEASPDTNSSNQAESHIPEQLKVEYAHESDGLFVPGSIFSIEGDGQGRIERILHRHPDDTLSEELSKDGSRPSLSDTSNSRLIKLSYPYTYAADDKLERRWLNFVILPNGINKFFTFTIDDYSLFERKPVPTAGNANGGGGKDNVRE